MRATALRQCRVSGCGQAVLPALASELLCLDHFLGQAFARVEQALELCQKAEPLDPDALDWLVADAQVVAQALSGQSNYPDMLQREKVLELLLCLTNLQDYVTHHSVKLARAD